MTLGQIAFEGFHGHRHYDEWPADDKIAQKWERCAAAVVAALHAKSEGPPMPDGAEANRQDEQE